MKYYLSSYKIGNKVSTLQEMTKGKRIALIPNALDWRTLDEQHISNAKNLKLLHDLGINAEVVDLKQYFKRPEELQNTLDTFDGVWIKGGNTFVLRQAMYLSGFDTYIQDKQDTDFFYGGYSAGVCILAPSLKGLQQVDDPTQMPYEESQTTLFTGLNILPYLVLPHYKSDHPESADIDKEIEYCTRHNIPFKTLRDGEVIIIE